ncbi:MAG: FAD-binding protein, partial [Flavisolibacter sp.]
MASAPQIQTTNLKSLSNIHNTFRQQIDNLFNIANGDGGSILERYNATTNLISQFLARAVAQKKSIRAMGANWSFTKVGFTKDWIVSTGRLNMMKRTLAEEMFDPAGYQLDKYLFAQCGCAVQELSKALRQLGRSLKTCGASNGQTIVGASAANTHGSAIDVGSTQDFIVGLHIIVSPDKHIYLERDSSPVISELFAQKLNAKLVRS